MQIQQIQPPQIQQQQQQPPPQMAGVGNNASTSILEQNIKVGSETKTQTKTETSFIDNLITKCLKMILLSSFKIKLQLGDATPVKPATTQISLQQPPTKAPPPPAEEIPPAKVEQQPATTTTTTTATTTTTTTAAASAETGKPLTQADALPKLKELQNAVLSAKNIEKEEFQFRQDNVHRIDYIPRDLIIKDTQADFSLLEAKLGEYIETIESGEPMNAAMVRNIDSMVSDMESKGARVTNGMMRLLGEIKQIPAEEPPSFTEASQAAATTTTTTAAEAEDPGVLRSLQTGALGQRFSKLLSYIDSYPRPPSGDANATKTFNEKRADREKLMDLSGAASAESEGGDSTTAITAFLNFTDEMLTKYDNNSKVATAIKQQSGQQREEINELNLQIFHLEHPEKK